MNNLAKLASVAAIFACSFHGEIHAQLFDFNTAGDLTNSFQTPAVAEPAFNLELFSESASGGLNNSRAIAVPSFPDFSQDQFWGTNASFDGTAAINTISIYARTPGTVQANGYLSFGMMADATSGGTTFPNSGDFLGVAIRSSGTDPDYKISGEGALNFQDGAFTEGLLANQWYLFELSFSHTFATNYSIQFNAWKANSDGSLGGSITGGTVFAGLTSELANDTTTHAYFGGTSTQNGFVYLDNFEATAIPEPSAGVLLTGILAGTFVLINRRHRKTVSEF